MQKLRVGVIGYGGIAKARHIPYYLSNKNVELVAICDINKSALNGLNINTYMDYHEMLENEELDLIDICTPPSGHVEQSIDCLTAGCNIIVEKPFTYTVADCDKVLDIARKNNKEVCVIHSSLFFPSMIRAQKMIDKLGEIKSIRIRYDDSLEKHVFCNNWITKMPAGALHEQMPHISYLVRKFIKPDRAIVNAFKVGDTSLPYDHYCIILHEDGKVCNIDLHYGKNWKVELVLVGTKKQMYIDLLNQHVEVTSLHDSIGVANIFWNCLYQILNQTRSLFENMLSYSKPYGHAYIINSYVEHLLNGTPPPITMDEVRETVRITELVTTNVENP